MRHDGCPTAANVLRHTDTRAGHLVGPGQTGELLHHFDDLIDASRPHRMAATLEPTHRADRQLAVDTDQTLLRPTPALTTPGKAARFEAQRTHDGKCIM